MRAQRSNPPQASRALAKGSALILAAALLTACAPEEPAVESSAEPVVVFAATRDDAFLREVFAEYTKSTGVTVIVRRGEPQSIVDDLIENRVSPPADMLVTRSVVDVWRAAEDGALRALYSDGVRAAVPQWARDPDDLWFGIAYRTAIIVHGSGVSAAEVPDLASLADSRLGGSLCLASSDQPINRVMIAMLIDGLGARPAELAVRAWMQNLALPPFPDEAKLLGAIRNERCGVGVVSTSALAEPNAASNISFVAPPEFYADIDGVGVARHARNPEGAVALVHWLVSASGQAAYAARSQASPVGDPAGNPRNVGVVAWRWEDAVKLAERAQYR